MRLSHPNCMVKRCEVCLSEHEELGKYLDTLCGTGNKVDHLGKIHLWMSKQGINPETEWGWAIPETFSEENIRQYVADFKEVEVGEVNQLQYGAKEENDDYADEDSMSDFVDFLVIELFGDSLSSGERVDVGNNIYQQLQGGDNE